MMGMLFDVEAHTITYHLKEIYDSGELERDGKILKSDVSIAKNYLSKEEVEDLLRIVNVFLEYLNRWPALKARNIRFQVLAFHREAIV